MHILRRAASRLLPIDRLFRGVASTKRSCAAASMSAAPAPPPDERPATAPSPRRGRLSATHRVAAKLNLVRDSSMERLDLEHRIAAWQRQRRVAMLSRHDFILENRNELPTRTLASVYQRRSKLYVEQCHKGEQARVRRSEQIRQVEQRIFEKGLRDVRRHAEVQQRRDEVSLPCTLTHLSSAAFPI